MDFRKQFAVSPGKKLKLATIDPAQSGGQLSNEAALPEISKYVTRMAEMQALLYANADQSLLVVLQALDAAGKDGVADDVMRLAEHPLFDAGNPNKVRALFATFAMNQRHFHAADGSGYRLLADRILAIDSANPILAGRLARFFNPWRRQEPVRPVHVSPCQLGNRHDPDF